jgi:alpha-1,3/alpha-1,6-mannosyltransferase
MLGGDGEIHVNVDRRKMLELYSNCYAVLYAPKDEDFGIVPLEAMAAYKPCIAVNEGGPKEVVADGKTGYLVNSESEMAERMRFLADDINTVEKLGKTARKHVEDNFSWERFMKRFGEQCRRLSKA